MSKTSKAIICICTVLILSITSGCSLVDNFKSALGLSHGDKADTKHTADISASEANLKNKVSETEQSIDVKYPQIPLKARDPQVYQFANSSSVFYRTP